MEIARIKKYLIADGCIIIEEKPYPATDVDENSEEVLFARRSISSVLVGIFEGLDPH